MPCNAHTLNLVVNDAAKVSFQLWIFLVMCQQYTITFPDHLFDGKFKKKHVKSLTVKQVSVTRWESRIKANRPLRHELGEIYDSLIELAEECSTPIGQHEAKCLAMKIKSYKFICSTVIWYEILEKVNVIIKMMQTVSWNLTSCAESINNILILFQRIRNDEKFEKYLKIADELCESLEIQPEFSVEINLRRRHNLTMKELRIFS